MPARRPAPLAACLLLLLLLLPACTQRTITVTSEPPGALVWLNDVQVGRTPVRTDFLHYGRYDVRVRLDGYEPVLTSQRTDVPLWDHIGVDLVTEALPVNARSEPTFHFVLTPVPERSDDPATRAAAETAVIDRARETRAALGEPPVATHPATP